MTNSIADIVEYVIMWGVYRHPVKNILQENVGKTNTAKFK